MKNNMKTLSLDGFKNLLRKDESFKEKIITQNDVIDIDNGHMLIHRSNINKYLERYMCKNEEDLEDTLWFNMGVYVQIVD